MKRIRGMVLEIKGRRAVILTPDGDFREVPVYRPDWEIGQTIEVPVREPIALDNRRQVSARGTREAVLERLRQWRWPAAVLIVAMLLATAAIAYPWADNAQQPAFAAVSLDLYGDNYRLYVDSSQRVISASAASEEGMLSLKDMPYEGKSLEHVMDLLFREAISRGELKPQGEDQVVLMSASLLEVPESPEQEGNSVARLKEGMEKAGSEGKAKLEARDVEAPVTVLTVTDGLLQERADQLGLSVNQYLVLLEARDMGLELTIADMRGKRFVSRLRKQGVNLDELLVQVQTEDDLAGLSAEHHEALLNERQPGKGNGKRPSDGTSGTSEFEFEPAAPAQGPADGQQGDLEAVRDAIARWLMKLKPASAK